MCAFVFTRECFIFGLHIKKKQRETSTNGSHTHTRKYKRKQQKKSKPNAIGFCLYIIITCCVSVFLSISNVARTHICGECAEKIVTGRKCTNQEVQGTRWTNSRGTKKYKNQAREKKKKHDPTEMSV